MMPNDKHAFKLWGRKKTSCKFRLRLLLHLKTTVVFISVETLFLPIKILKELEISKNLSIMNNKKLSNNTDPCFTALNLNFDVVKSTKLTILN